MKKLILALGDKVAEEFILNEAMNIKIIGLTNQLGELCNLIKSNKPDVLVIRDNLSNEGDFLSTITKIKSENPNLRIIVIAAGRKPGDILLAKLVRQRIYDILYGEEINIYQVINLINYPLKIDDVKQLINIHPEYNNLDSLSNHKGQTVISCWGAFDTLGTSTTALNLAINYAKNGNRTILVELNNHKPSLNLLLGFGHQNLGTDTAIKGKMALESAIVKVKDLQLGASGEIEWLKPLIRSLPNKLDFLMFSETYCFGKAEEISNQIKIRELISSIVFHQNYDIVIFDLPTNLENELTKIAVEMSNYILNLLIPDYAILIYTRNILNQLEQDNPGILKRFRPILNQNLDEEPDIETFFGLTDLFKLPYCSNLRRGQIRDIYLPATLSSECNNYNQAIENLIDNITPNLLKVILKPNKKDTIFDSFKRIMFNY